MDTNRGPQKEGIAYRSYNRIRNVGDAIAPYVLETLTGFRPSSVSHDVPHVLSVGSIFFMATDCSYIWGSGILNPQSHIPEIAPTRITAVRGKRTAELLTGRGVALRDVPLGDPGIFAADILNTAANRSKPAKFKAAVVPHHSSINHPFYRQLKDSAEFVLVDVLDDTLAPLHRIAESEIVISQSLHGLIFAESLRKPSIWISNQDNPAWRFKFDDWFSTTANPQAQPLPLNVGVAEALSAAELRDCTIDKRALRQALPVASVIHDMGSPLEFKVCRGFAPVVISTRTIFSGNIYSSFEELRGKAAGIGFLAFEMFSKMFARWSERAYLCVHPDDDDIPFSHAKLRTMCRWLDHHLEPDAAYILSRAVLPQSNVKLEDLGGGVAVLQTPTLLGGALLLRPDFGKLSDRFVTFVV